MDTVSVSEILMSIYYNAKCRIQADGTIGDVNIGLIFVSGTLTLLVSGVYNPRGVVLSMSELLSCYTNLHTLDNAVS
jgi:hypothetical protein